MDVRDQQRIDVLARWREGSLTVEEATARLGASERTAWRLRHRFAAMGADGIVHGNRGRASPRRLPTAERSRIVELAKTRYRGVNDSHLAELLAEDEGIVIGRSSLQRLLRQAKGRVERLWGTCQDRLVSELRLAGADDLARANAVLERFIPRFNAKFAVPPALEQPAWRPAPPARELAHICAFRWWRVVGNDNTVRVEGAVLQLPPTHGGRGLAGRRVEVELHLDGRLLVVDRGRVLLVLSAPPDPHQLRGVTLVDPAGPTPAAGGSERPGYPPRANHPWNRPGPKAPSRASVTESLSR